MTISKYHHIIKQKVAPGKDISVWEKEVGFKVIIYFETKWVIRMCFSNNFIEQQAYEMSKKIREHSRYKFLRLEFSGETRSGNQNGEALITKVILEDEDGTLYSVEPNPIGLRFAKGEISYKEYRKLQSKETSLVFVSLFAIIGFFSVVMFTLSRYFI